uniref:Uncharacterized protein n=1 Tax=Theileria annulata TaxID=5874 RepID=A0A3B0MZI4_THEAN
MDVEKGYYTELSSFEMSNSFKKNDSNKNPKSTDRRPKERPTHVTDDRPTDLPYDRLDDRPTDTVDNTQDDRLDGSEEFIDTMNEIYSLDKGKTKLYKEFFKLYTDPDESNIEVDNFEPGQSRRKIFLWLLIIILISNPILGGYNLHHFTNYYNNFNQSQLIDIFNPKINNSNKKWYQFSFTVTGPPSNKVTGNKDTTTIGASTVTEGKGANSTDELMEFKRVCDVMSMKICRYSFYEVFGEIIFGIFSLLLMSLCKLPCNNGNSIRFMMPILFILYMLIYRILAFYILIITIKITFYSIITMKPQIINWIPYYITYFLSIHNINPYKDLSILKQIYKLDEFGIKILWLFCLENVYITFSESMELFMVFIKLIFSLIRKILKYNELNFYSNNESGFKFFKCFSRDTFYSSDPHEKYIHSLYNYASDIGTYLKNINVDDYTQGLDDLTNKFKNRQINNQ